MLACVTEQTHEIRFVRIHECRSVTQATGVAIEHGVMVVNQNGSSNR